MRRSSARFAIPAGCPMRLFCAWEFLSLFFPSLNCSPQATAFCALCAPLSVSSVLNLRPFFSITCALFRFPYPVNPYPTHSYKNCRGVPQLFPNWNRASTPAAAFHQSRIRQLRRRREGRILIKCAVRSANLGTSKRPHVKRQVEWRALAILLPESFSQAEAVEHKKSAKCRNARMPNDKIRGEWRGSGYGDGKKRGPFVP